MMMHNATGGDVALAAQTGVSADDPPHRESRGSVAPLASARHALDTPTFRPVLWVIAAFAFLLVLTVATMTDGDSDAQPRVGQQATAERP